MSGAWQIGRLFGISVKVHFSWVFIFALIAWSLATSYLPTLYEGWSDRMYWIIGIASAALLFVSVLIHEFSHSLMAISRGHQVQSITLFFLGGVSEIQEESETAGEEFWISVVGPLTSLVLAIVSGIAWLLTPQGAQQVQAITGYLAIVNLLLAFFNMLPAFPLDGGRVLKSVVWKATGSEERATTISSLTGSVLGFAIIGIGFFFAFTGNLLSGIWFIFIGWFIQSAASSTRRQRGVTRALSGKFVRDAMREDAPLPTVAPGVNVQALVDQYIGRDFERAYLVTLGDTYYGLVTVSDVKKVPPEERGQKWVTEIMTRANEVRSIHPDDNLEKALEALVETGYHQLVVVNSNGQPVALLTRGDVLRVLEIAQLFPGERISERASVAR